MHEQVLPLLIFGLFSFKLKIFGEIVTSFLSSPMSIAFTCKMISIFHLFCLKLSESNARSKLHNSRFLALTFSRLLSFG